MTGVKTIELIFFDGCPKANDARENIRSALQWEGSDAMWTEWDLFADSTPEHLRQHGCPTVLIDGRDVTGDHVGAVAIACRTDVPSPTLIIEKLR